jgi:hypothetical protein
MVENSKVFINMTNYYKTLLLLKMIEVSNKFNKKKIKMKKKIMFGADLLLMEFLMDTEVINLRMAVILKAICYRIKDKDLVIISIGMGTFMKVCMLMTLKMVIILFLGYGRFVKRNGDFYEGLFKNGKYDGLGKLF